jgi:hypothetical protein
MKIEKSKNWNYAIDIKFNPYSNIDISEIYSTVLWFTSCKIPCIAIAICWETNDRTIVMENTPAYEFKKMNLHSFQKWYINRIFYDKKYDVHKKMTYCFKIIFGKIMVETFNAKHNSDVLNELKPHRITKKTYINKKRLLLLKIYRIFPFTRKIK